ncbi:hypothetical protein KNE206_20640 [Kitasatospora sp. NE20-6]
MGERGLTEVTGAPRQIRPVTVAAAVRMGTTRTFCPSLHRWMGRITLLRRMEPTLREGRIGGAPASGESP